MKTILLTVTEHPGRKSGRFTYQAVENGQVIYETTTDRTYVAILLEKGLKRGSDGRQIVPHVMTMGAAARYGRFDLLAKAKLDQVTSNPYALARIDFVETVNRVRVLEMVQEYLTDPNCRPQDWGQSDMAPAEHRAFVLEAEEALRLMKEEPVEEVVNSEAELIKLGNIAKLADQVIKAMDEMGLGTWEEFEPYMTAVLDIKLRARAKESDSEHSIPDSHV